MRIALLFSALILSIAGCSEKVFVTVNCETVADPAVVCIVKQTKGKSEVETCWSFAATCENGTKVEAPRACVKIKDGATLTHRTEGAQLKNLDQCAGSKPPTATLTNLTINGEASTQP
jgi:hypothetical protein